MDSVYPCISGHIGKRNMSLAGKDNLSKGVQENQTIEHCFQLNTIYILQYCQVQMHDELPPVWVSTFIQVLITRPNHHHMEIMAWSLPGFPSGPLPVLHIILVLRFMQKVMDQLPMQVVLIFAANHNKFSFVFDCCFTTHHHL